MRFDTNDLKENLKNYQKKATDQFKNFAENDWPDIKDHLTEKGQQVYIRTINNNEGKYLGRSNSFIYWLMGFIYGI